MMTLQELRDRGQVEILDRTAKENVRKILPKLVFPMFRNQLEDIFFFLLYGSQNTPTTFLSILPTLPSTLEKLSLESPTTSTIISRLVEAVRFHPFLTIKNVFLCFY